MSITVYAYKLTQRELEARLEPGITVLPGQLLRFEGSKPSYGKVSEVRALPVSAAGMPEGYGVVIDRLHGSPGLGAQKVTLLTTAQMAREVQKLQGRIQHPLQFAGHFVGELANLGAFTLVEGDDFLLKYDALQVVINAAKPYRRLLIIDPLGLFEEGDGFTYLKAGSDVRLSIQQVGSKRFLEAFGELFSPELRVPAMRTLADHWPLLSAESEFIGFNRLLNLEAAVNVPLKNLIVQHYHTVVQHQVFADAPEQMLNLGQSLRQPVCVVDISDLPAPWKQLVYEQLCETVFREGGGGLIPVLLYPEKYLPDLLGWAQRAEEAGFNMLVMAAPFAGQSLREKANNRVWADSRSAMELQGSLTLGLPVSFPLPTHQDDTTSQEEKSEPAYAERDHGAEPQVAAEARTAPRNEEPVTSSLLGVTPPQGMELSEPHDQRWEPATVVPQKNAGDTWSSESSGGVPMEVALPDEATPDEEPPPIIDLSSPQPEPVITFLTAEQLSELLASSPKSQEDGDETSEEWEARMPTEPQVDLESDSSDYLDLDYPETAEGAPSPASARSAPSVEIPMLFEEEPPDLIDETGDSGFAYSSFQVDLDDETEPVARLNPEVSMQAPVDAALPPPFPAPEEYEREEFSFDLNPDDAMLAESANGHAMAGEDGIADTVSRSLSEFEGMDLELDEPLFELNPEDYNQAPSQTEESQPVAPVGAVSGEIQSANAGLADAEMQEALDLMFPHQAANVEQQPADAAVAMPSAPEAALMGDEEEHVPIYQKPEAQMAGKHPGYQVGDKVRHKAYGEGVIQKIIPMDETVILNITFEAVGKRLLDPSLCELKQDPD